MGKPIYLKVEKTIDQPLEQVWETVALGFPNVSDYNPEIKSSHLDSSIRQGIGTIRHCDFPKKGYIKEKIIEWEDSKFFKLTFIESSVPMAMLQSKFSFETQNGSTKITQEFWYRMKAPMGWMSVLMKGKMKATLENGLNGLEAFFEKKPIN